LGFNSFASISTSAFADPGSQQASDPQLRAETGACSCSDKGSPQKAMPIAAAEFISFGFHNRYSSRFISYNHGRITC